MQAYAYWGANLHQKNLNVPRPKNFRNNFKNKHNLFIIALVIIGMDKSEILVKIKHLNIQLEKAINDPQLTENIPFLKAVIQQSAVSLYQAASELDQAHTEPKAPGIKIIRQEEVLEKKPEPVMEKPIMEKPVVHEVVEKEVIESKVIKAEPEVITKVAPVQKPRIEAKVEIPADDEREEELTLNEKLARNKKPVQNIADKSTEKPIKDLVKHIPIVKKFEFINGLFDGNADAYKTALTQVESSGSYELATGFLETSIIEPFDWQSKEDLAAEFFALVKRRYS